MNKFSKISNTILNIKNAIICIKEIKNWIRIHRTFIGNVSNNRSMYNVIACLQRDTISQPLGRYYLTENDIWSLTTLGSIHILCVWNFQSTNIIKYINYAG